MAPARNRFFEIHDAVKGLIFEAFASSEKEALYFGRFRVWAQDKSHPGLRRILCPSDPWPVLVEEANYIAASRLLKHKSVAGDFTPAEVEQRAQYSAKREAERRAAEKVAYAQRLEAVRANQAARCKRRLALDARLGRHRPIPSLPTQDPTTGEWI